MRDNFFGILVKIALALWTGGALYLCGGTNLAWIDRIAEDDSGSKVVGAILGNAIAFAVWAVPAVAMTIAYLIFGRSGRR